MPTGRCPCGCRSSGNWRASPCRRCSRRCATRTATAIWRCGARWQTAAGGSRSPSTRATATPR
ncbi:hypothetical protein ACFVWX_01670 [Streptomyces sp. NPDC058220]|uniref:hypothetical protein n=1 Tax=unclassified Streptomyces TaxID=2593676 RepID=UPI00364B85C5